MSKIVNEILANGGKREEMEAYVKKAAAQNLSGEVILAQLNGMLIAR